MDLRFFSCVYHRTTEDDDSISGTTSTSSTSSSTSTISNFKSNLIMKITYNNHNNAMDDEFVIARLCRLQPQLQDGKDDDSFFVCKKKSLFVSSNCWVKTMLGNMEVPVVRKLVFSVYIVYSHPHTQQDDDDNEDEDDDDIATVDDGDDDDDDIIDSLNNSDFYYNTFKLLLVGKIVEANSYYIHKIHSRCYLIFLAKEVIGCGKAGIGYISLKQTKITFHNNFNNHYNNNNNSTTVNGNDEHVAKAIDNFNRRNYIPSTVSNQIFMKTLKEEYNLLVKLINDPSLGTGVLLIGPSGVGKTSLILSAASHCSAAVFRINAVDTMAKFGGNAGAGSIEKYLSNIFSKAEKIANPKLILIDDIDILCPSRSETLSSSSSSSSASSASSQQQKQQSQRIVGQLLTLMNGNIFVCATVKNPIDVDIALRRPGRLETELRIGYPDTNSRKEIIKYYLSSSFSSSPSSSSSLNEEQLKSIVEMTMGFSGSDLRHLCHQSLVSKYLNNSTLLNMEEMMKSIIHEIRMTMATKSQHLLVIDNQNANNSNGNNHDGNTDDVDDVWKNIGGQSQAKLALQQAVEWPIKYAEGFKRFGLKSPRGILLYGPPGCSKTTLAKAVARSSKCNFFTLNGATIYSAYLGEAERIVREAFANARGAAPSVIFIDEIDAIISSRNLTSSSSSSSSSLDGGVSERVLATLLNEMDGVESIDGVLVLAATNRIDRIDAALLRPGRFDRCVHVGLPNHEDRIEILKIHSSSTPLHEDVDLNNLATKLEGYSGAEIQGFVKSAALAALRRDIKINTVQMRDFESVISFKN